MGTRVALTVQTMSRTAVNVSTANKVTVASANGVYFDNTGKEFLYAENTDSSDLTMTVQTGKTVDGLALADKTYTLQETGTAGDIIIAGPFPTDTYNQNGGQVWVDAGTDAKLKVMVFQLTPVN